MNPNAKDYTTKILVENGIKYPLTKQNLEKVDAFLDAIDGCTWEDPKGKVEERQFETSLKGYFKEFEKELILFHLQNPPTMNGKKGPYKNHRMTVSMDDQGFEGQIMDDGSFYRWINDLEVGKK